jgi:GntR family transcriptional regulator
MHIAGVDRESNIPLYVQVCQYWRARIAQNQLKPGDQLPTEAEMAKFHGVSKITVRQAVHLLVNEGLVATRQGKGTFVRAAKHQWDLSKLYSFSEDMKMRGFTPGARVLKKEIVKGPVEQLKLDDSNALTIRVERLRLADNEPMAIELLRIPYEPFADIYDDIVDNVSIYGLVEHKIGIKPAYGTQFIEAALPDRREQKLLEIDAQEAVLKLERVSFSRERAPIEHTISIYRGDQYRFRVTLER